jgi:hypothetical protein
VPILTFLQVILAAVGGWVGGLHPLNAFVVLALYGWLFHRLRRAQPEAAARTSAAT